MILVPDLHDVLVQATSDGERRVARLLAGLDGPDDAVAFHSVKLRSHGYKQQAEADFVLLWRGVVIVVEVKGGGVRKHDGTWFSIDRHGDWHRLTESPMEQARSAMFALRSILQEDGLGWFAHEAVVVTPDIDAPPPSVEWKSTHWLAASSMNRPALRSAVDSVASQSRRAPGTQKVARQDQLRMRLFGEFTRMPALDAQRGAVIDEQNRATEDQARVLACLARNDRVMVCGGAGTGKSLLAVEAAKQEAASGRRVLITFGSSSLEQFFRPFIVDRSIDVIAYGRLRADQQYDVVLVDEAQDLMIPSVMDRLDEILVGGRANGRWRMFLDPNNQIHVDGSFDEEVYQLVAAEAILLDLSRNVRNTRAIVHVVQEYLGADVGDPAIVHGEQVNWHWIDGQNALGEGIRVAQALVAEGSNKRGMWVISVRSQDEPVMQDGFSVLSPRSAKGLEAERVVVCDLPPDYDDRAVAALYVAVTRARVALHIVASAADKERLQELLRRQAGAT